MPISAVVDASILVSAFLFPASIPGRVVKLAGQGRFTMHLSPLLLDETRTALLSARLILLSAVAALTVTTAHARQRDNLLALRVSREANQCQQPFRDPGSLSESIRPVRPDETEATCIARVRRETPLPPMPDEVVQFLAHWHITPEWPGISHAEVAHLGDRLWSGAAVT